MAATSPDIATAEQRFWDNLAKGQAKADEMFKEGSLGRMGDSELVKKRQAEMDEQLAKLKASQDGMTPQEMQAAREQGRVEIDRQLAQNQRGLGASAAANGVRGASAAGLQARAGQQAQAASGDLARKLVVDNLAQRNFGTQLYGNTLQGQQETALGIQKEDLGAQRSEAFGRASLPFQIAGGLDAAGAGARADWFGQQQIDLGQGYLDNLKNGGNAPLPTVATTPAGGAAAPAEAPANNSGLPTANPDGSPLSQDQVDMQVKATIVFAESQGGTPSVNAEGKVVFTMPDGTVHTTNLTEQQYNATKAGMAKTQEDNDATQKESDEAANVAAGKNPDGSSKTPARNEYEATGKTQPGCAPGVYCYVMTQAVGAGLLDRRLYDDTVTRCPTKRTNGRAYGVWGPLLAKVMAKSPLVAKAISWLIPDTVKMLRGEPARLRGVIAYYSMYVPFTWMSKLYLKVK